MSLIGWVLERIGMQIVPSVDFLALYPARVVSQSGQTVDVQCDDARVGSLSSVPLQLGYPGGEATVAAGARVLVGWRGGDPRYPYIGAWETGATVTAITIRGTTVYLGSDSGSNFVALANLVDAELTKVATAHNTHVHILTLSAGTGTAASPAIQYARSGVGATQVKAV